MTVIQIDQHRDTPKKPSIKKLMSLVESDLTKVNEHLMNSLQSQVPLIPQLASHLILSGGKRLRPVLLLASAQMGQYTGERHTGLAACVELIHTATLLHDDVVDESDKRRGHDTANSLWGNQASVLVGDFLFTRAFQLMVKDGSLKSIKILSDTINILTEGEVQQLINTNDPEITEDAYMEAIRCKTAVLFEGACRLGGVVWECTDVEEQALASYGSNLGIAFQLVDDILDYDADEDDLGKNLGDDFREGKVTLPILLAWARGSDADRTFWRRTIADLNQQDGDFETALSLLKKYDCLEDTRTRAKYYGEKAKDCLGIFPDSTMKECLKELIDYSLHRVY